jgi:hypothetical protein
MMAIIWSNRAGLLDEDRHQRLLTDGAPLD